jgi:hypothetical protein
VADWLRPIVFFFASDASFFTSSHTSYA